MTQGGWGKEGGVTLLFEHLVARLAHSLHLVVLVPQDPLKAGAVVTEDLHRHTQTEGETERDRGRGRDRHRERQGGERDTERDRGGERQRGRETEGERETES